MRRSSRLRGRDNCNSDATPSTPKLTKRQRRQTEEVTGVSEEKTRACPLNDVNENNNNKQICNTSCEWLQTIITQEQRTQFDQFLREHFFLNVAPDFYDVFELASVLNPDKPLG